MPAVVAGIFLALMGVVAFPPFFYLGMAAIGIGIGSSLRK